MTTPDRKTLELQMKSCMTKHADFVRCELMPRFSRQVIVETLIGAAAILTIEEIRSERPDISERNLEEMASCLLTEFQKACDSILAKHLDQGDRN